MSAPPTPSTSAPRTPADPLPPAGSAQAALWLLARRKLRGRLRAQARRLKTPSGVVLAVLGVALFGLWIVAVQFRPGMTTAERDPEALAAWVRVGGLFLVLFTIGSSVTHRGLFLPKEEIERLFSAPLSRPQIVRYRLIVNVGRSLFAGAIFGLILMGQMPRADFAFLGLMVAMQTLPVLGQATAILAGGLERRSLQRLHGWPGGLARFVCFALGMVVFLVLAFGGSGTDVGVLDKLSKLAMSDSMTGLVEHPLLVAAALPFEPWARAITATDGPTFGLWIGICLAIWLALFELTARLPIDFRELSLETSAHVAERIRRHRRVGGGASAARVSRLTLSWRIPWVWGRGPSGAIAWRKATSIVRKARGTLIVSVFVLSLVTLFVAAISGGNEREKVVGGAVVIALLGTLYLGAGLRFDFREDLDRMEAIKAWPHSARRIFAATLIPEVLLIAALEVVGIGVRALATGQFDPWLFAVAASVPLFVFAWVALDNAVFLFAPVRLVPGQEGALQNAGRAMLMMLVRGAMLGVIGVAVGLGFLLGFAALRYPFGLEGTAPLVAGTLTGWSALLGCDLGLVALGGKLFRRFDVARDRG
jgi:hypothetical protein